LTINEPVLWLSTIEYQITHQDNEFKIKTLEKMPVFGIFVPLTFTISLSKIIRDESGICFNVVTS